MNSAEALARAQAHYDSGQFADADADCRRILAAEPNHAETLHLLGLISLAAGSLASAAQSIERAIAANGASAIYHSNLGEIYRLLGRLDAAEAACERALALAPGAAEALNNLGIVHYERGDYARAAELYRRAIAQAPTLVAAHGNLANALRAQHRFDDAIATYRQAVALDHTFADGWANLGLTFALLGRHDEAHQAYRAAIAADPLHANGHVGVALQMLLRGDFANGWFEYQWRWRSSEMTPLRLPMPEWQGDTPAGKHILLVAEQGLGDTIQFCRYAALLRDRGARVTLRVQQPLVRLLAANLPWTAVSSDTEPVPAADFHCPLLSLPLLFGTDAGTIPGVTPYLRAPVDLAAAWRAELTDRTKLRVGLAWAGNPKHVNDHNRSLPLPALVPLFAIEGIDWVSLQVGPRAGDAPAAPVRLLDPSARLGDFLDTAALVSQLDLVISIDSAVAHLGGAMGVPVWLMLPVGTDWRWQLDRTDTPWYPTVQLFRQRDYGAWQPVVAELAAGLAALARAKTR